MPRLSANLLPTSTVATTVAAGAIVVGTKYRIVSVGTTDWTLIGAASNTVGVVFTATAVGTGSGTASVEVEGSNYKGDGYYRLSDGVHTIAHFLNEMQGTLEVQGSLAADPVDADWVTLSSYTGTGAASAGYADALLTPSQVGTTAPFDPGAVTYDFDVTIDGGANQQLSIVTAGGETFTQLAALMSAEVVGGTVTFVSSSFRVTSDAASGTSAATIAAGTAGSGGGDLFAAIDGEMGTTTSFPTPTPGSADGRLTENRTYNFTGNFVWIRAVVTSFVGGTITKIQLNF